MKVTDRRTHQHHLDGVCHEPHVGLQDVVVEGWGEHAPVLEPRLPVQQEQTIPWARDECACVCVGDRIKRTTWDNFGVQRETWGRKKKVHHGQRQKNWCILGL